MARIVPLFILFKSSLNYYIFQQMLSLTRNDPFTQNKYKYLPRGSAFCLTENNIFVSCQFWQGSQIRHSHLSLPPDIHFGAAVHCLFNCTGRTAFENKLQTSQLQGSWFQKNNRKPNPLQKQSLTLNKDHFNPAMQPYKQQCWQNRGGSDE